jgi:hypothetical protein
MTPLRDYAPPDAPDTVPAFYPRAHPSCAAGSTSGLERTAYSIVPGAPERWSTAPPPSRRRASGLALRVGEGEELTSAQRGEIDAMYASLATWTHYEILGVSPGVGLLVLDAMYEARLAAFHPDAFGRKPLGAYLRRLEIIVQCAGEAHATLRDPVQRKAYDRRLAPQLD